MANKLGRMFLLAAGAAMLLVPVGAFALNNGYARTPPMGFSTWNYFGCNGINEANVMAVAQSMVQIHAPNWEGKQISLQSVGYKFINLDDCWPATSRLADSAPTWNTTRFPHGFPWLTDTIHNMGLKIGIYSCCGTETCAGYIGSYGYEKRDALTYVQWGFDYLKEDWCNVPSAYTNGAGAATLYSRMGHALAHADSVVYLDTLKADSNWTAAKADSMRKVHGITFSLCNWGDYSPWLFGDSCGNLWRCTGDINASWSSIYSNWSTTIALYQDAGPGGWNDPDILEIGNGSLTNTQNQSHMDMWCICAAPLLMGNNTPAMSAATFTILSNREVIAVDQDSLGVQGHIARTTGNIQVIVKKLLVHNADTVNNKKFAVVILNSSTTAAAVGSIKWSDLGISDTSKQFRVRNLWLHRWLQSRNILDTTSADTGLSAIGVTESLYVASIPAYGTVHVLMEMGNPDSVSSVPASVLPQDNEQVTAQLGSRISVRGNEVYIPVGLSKLQVFDMKGRQIALISASQPGWYSLSGRGVVHGGTYLIRLNTPAGVISRVVAFVK